ncbi:MAG TPA: NAD(P)H-dependent oxidoreductase [Anaerolineaceae bacterium]|nr:NAD(P)H-dependent oxidoreductase [Anaerolineaceae bacterium]
MAITSYNPNLPSPPESIRFLVFSASLRGESLNTRLAGLAARTVEKNGGKVDMASMEDFDCPSYNQDSEVRQGFPPGAAEFHRRLEANDAFIIVSPEYNVSMPGVLKNAIDWVSRYRPQPFNERHVLLMAGGNRGLWSLRIPLEHLGARVFPDMFSLAMVHQALNSADEIINPTLADRFVNNIVAFISLAEAAKNYPCLKKAWVELLGEQPDPAIDRVE